MSDEDHTGTNRMSVVNPLLLVLVVGFGLYLQYWTIRYAVRHALADADERRSASEENGRSIGS